MKISTPLIAVLSAMAWSIGNAFTVDAVGYSGAVLSQNPYSIFIPGYGELVFEPGPGLSLVVNSAYQTDNGFDGLSLGFDPDDSVKIAFVESESFDEDSDSAGRSTDDSLLNEKSPFTPEATLMTIQGKGDGVGRFAIQWATNSIPEPTSLALGLLVSVMLVMRRRR
jgi:hypothetical protein